MSNILINCPRCKLGYHFFSGPDDLYEVGEVDCCPRCKFEVSIDWDGEEGTEELKRNIFWLMP